MEAAGSEEEGWTFLKGKHFSVCSFSRLGDEKLVIVFVLFFILESSEEVVILILFLLSYKR